MAAFVSIDSDNRIFDVTRVPVNGLSSIDGQIEIYSDLKEEWFTTPSLQGFKFPFRTFGDFKNPTDQIGPYIFMNNALGWRMRAYDLDHELNVLGNLVPEDVTIPLWLARPGRTILINQEQSAQALTVQQALLTESVEGTLDVQDVLRIMLASAANKLSGAGTGTISIRDLLDGKNRIVATTDALGNRTNVVLDPSD